MKIVKWASYWQGIEIFGHCLYDILENVFPGFCGLVLGIILAITLGPTLDKLRREAPDDTIYFINRDIVRGYYTVNKTGTNVIFTPVK